MTLDELIVSLMTYELDLKRSEEDRKFKSIRLKAEEKSKAKKTSSEEGSSESNSDEDLALISRKLKSILKRRKNHNFSSFSRPRQSSKQRYKSNPNSKCHAPRCTSVDLAAHDSPKRKQIHKS